MDTQDLRKWLTDRKATSEQIEMIVDASDRIEKSYADLVKMGGAIEHSHWLWEALTDNAEQPEKDGIIWLMLSMTNALFYLVEEE